MEWPTCFPDMNPIEHVWDALRRRVAGRQPPPQTLQELEIALLDECDRIPQLVINSLIDSMPQRVIAPHSLRNTALRFGNIEYHHTAYVADITYPCFLGLGFLKNNNFKLDFENSNMHLKFEDITLFGLQTQFESDQKIIAKTKLSLSPRTEYIIPGLVAENKKFRFGLIDYPDPDSLKAGVPVALAVVDLSSSVIPVRIANISDRTRTIQEGESRPCASPNVLVKEKDGSARFCVDYRRLNDVTKKDSYTLLRIDDTLDTLAGNTLSSTLDLKSEYWQVELHPDDKKKTAFTTGQGLPGKKYLEIGKQFILVTDASHENIGAVLSQEIDGQERVIAYFSKCLSKPERSYCVTRKELLAIEKAVEHFHPYLYNRRFLLRTNHASLTWLLNFKNPEGQIARWIQRLQEYDVEIRHRKGSAESNGDVPSRRPFPENSKYCSRIKKKFGVIDQVVRQVTTTSALNPWSDESVRKDQLTDPEIKPIIEFK
ncbi:retrovirus-related Pol polyprotein from transposon 412 [Trichonephila clavipes]|nr:retrovirus-related Pol polyprotein from transposon 412 [Trichonephila clavipes]